MNWRGKQGRSAQKNMYRQTVKVGYRADIQWNKTGEIEREGEDEKQKIMEPLHMFFLQHDRQSDGPSMLYNGYFHKKICIRIKL